MTPIAASLIIVSRHRPAALFQALAAVVQMDHPNFEVVVVADPAAAMAVRDLNLPLKISEYDIANISAARNIGLQLASAPVVAFLDDDAVPEPTWLSRLVAPFENQQVTAAGGFVLGRSGLAWQWRAMWVDGDGFDHPFTAPTGISLHRGTAKHAIKTQGTNCAFRRDDLMAIGGFDEGFAFYLDEADVNLRLAARGGLTAIVPDAVVHHGFAASSRRRGDRTPTDLTQIGYSLARFTALHGQTPDALARHIANQHNRLIHHMVSGALEPGAVRRLLAGLHSGIAAAQRQNPPPPRKPLAATERPLHAIPNTGPRAGRLLFGTAAQRTKLEAEAKSAREAGHIVSLIVLARGLRAHTHSFSSQGWWVQCGGKYGRSFRSGSRFVFQPAPIRHRQESARIAEFRPIGPLQPNKNP